MRERRKYKMQNFISFHIVVIFFENCEKFSQGKVYHLSKMSLQGTIVPGRLRSEVCPWGVKVRKNGSVALWYNSERLSQNQGSTDRCDLVRDFLNFVGPGRTRLRGSLLRTRELLCLGFYFPLRIQNRVNSLSLNSIWRWIICFPV